MGEGRAEWGGLTNATREDRAGAVQPSPGPSDPVCIFKDEKNENDKQSTRFYASLSFGGRSLLQNIHTGFAEMKKGCVFALS